MPDTNNLSSSVMSFLHEDSIATAIKAMVAWQSQAGVATELTKLGIPQGWLTHPMAVFVFVLWSVDRLTRLYVDSKATPPPAK